MKLRKWLLIAALSVASVVSFTLAACTGGGVPTGDSQTDLTEGPETGVYYFDAPEGEYLITLSGGNRFTLHMQGADKSGVYTLDGSALTFDFTQDEDGTASATLADDVLTLTYADGEWRFLKKIDYTVTFEENGGSEVADVSVVNGQSFARPADPVRDGYKLIAWTTVADDLDTAFSFDSAIVTSNLTLYAYWAAYVPGQSEYVVDFQLNYDGETPDSMTTVGGRLFGVPEPTREGYVFDGWWVSMYDDGEKLSYRWTSDTVFTEDTTLFAVWNEAGTSPLRVYADSQGVSWDRLPSSATLTIQGPDGFDTITQNVGVSSEASYPLDFSNAPAGDYTITMALASGGETFSAYYKNKALARVSEFNVMGPAVLVFEGVENAQAYYITIECGNENHTHTEFALGTSTSYNFANCPMREGGIVFTVTAVADGYASSTSRAFVYDHALGAVTGLSVSDETLVWNSVAGATNYIVTVNGEEHDVGSSTRFSLKEYPARTLEISVRAQTKGYNSAAASTLTYEKTTLATPASVAVRDMLVTWDAVAGATGYEVSIGGQTFAVTGGNTTSYDLSGADIAWTDDDYQISVRAMTDSEASPWSDPVDARYLALSATLTYEHNILSWRSVIGAESYSVRVNGGAARTVSAGTTSLQITLSRAGINTIAVTFNDGAGDSKAVTLEVYAYTVSFDSRGGEAVSANAYVAVGDAFTLPGTTRTGYTLNGWYNTPGGAAGNGALYDDPYFSGNGDIILYANWTPRTYTITLDYGEYGAGSQTTAPVTYGQSYRLPVATQNDSAESGTKIFMGWYSSSDINSTRYTDELGNSLTVWLLADENVTLHAGFADAVEFVEDGDGYSVTAGDQIRRVSNLVIPAQYNGKNVVSIAQDAFRGISTLYSISIPDTIRQIDQGAFSNCNNLAGVYVYDTEYENDPVYYSSADGSLLYINAITQQTELAFVPRTLTGTYTVPDGVTAILTETFYGKTSGDDISRIVLPTTVTYVADGAFYNMRRLTEIEFEEGGTEPLVFSPTAIDWNTDSGNAIQVLTLPARLQEFEEAEPIVFARYTNLKEINIVGTYTGKDDEGNDIVQAYSSWSGMLLNGGRDTLLFCPIGTTLTQVTIPGFILNIGDYAFCVNPSGEYWSRAQHNNITSVTFHPAMREIGDYAFYRSENLETVVFPAASNPSELTIGEYAFASCPHLSTVTFNETGTMGTETVEDVLYYVYQAEQSCGIVKIGAHAFEDCPEIGEIVLPSTLELLGDYAFAEDEGLQDLDLSHIHYELEFGLYPFENCTGLTSVEITDNVGEIEFYAVFHGCSNLADFTVGPNNPNYSADDQGVIYNRDRTTIIYFPEGYDEATDGIYQIPSTVTRIGGAAFEGKSNLTQITIPATVTVIAENAFANCPNLATVTFDPADGEPLTIDTYAFYGCGKLTSITLPARTTSIGNYSFAATTTAGANGGLTSVTLNEGLTTIGEYAFRGQKGITSITIPSTVTSIGASAFAYSGLTGVNPVKFTQPSSGARTGLTLGNYVFAGTSIKEFTLPEGLAYIPEYAFNVCSSLTKVVIPTTVTNNNASDIWAIGYRAFNGCSSLTDVQFTAGGTLPLSIGINAFEDCTQLTSLTLPARASSFTSAQTYDVFEMPEANSRENPNFMGMPFADYYGNVSAPVAAIYVRTAADEGLEELDDFTPEFWSYDGVLYSNDGTLVFCPVGKSGEVVISKDAVTIRPFAFGYCADITSIVFEDSANAQGKDFYLADASNSAAALSTDMIFFGCESLESIALPVRLTSIGNYSLRTSNSNGGNVGLTTVTFAEGCRLTEIGDNAFYGARISAIELPLGVTTIGATPFNSCSSLTDITLSQYTTAEQLSAIINGSAIKKITIPEENENLLSENGIVYDAQKTSLVFISPEYEGDVTIPNTVTSIGNDAFREHAGIKAVTFEDGGTADLTIGNSAFRESSITSVELPARLSSLGTNVFRMCESLGQVTFEAGYDYATIPTYTFYNTAITSIALPAAVTSIGTYAFASCEQLVSVTFGNNGTDSRLTEIAANAFEGCTALGPEEAGGIVLPASFATLGNFAFRNCSALFSVTLLGNALTSIGSSTFMGCTSLTSIDLSQQAGLTTVNATAFANCGSLESIVLPASVTSIGTKAFQNCTSLESAVINSSANLPNYLFDGCTALLRVTLNNEIQQIGTYVFRNCASLHAINQADGVNSLPTQLTVLGYATTTAAYVFQNCTSLGNITIPDGVTSIARDNFSGCTALSSVVLGENVTAIYPRAFENCTSLTSITLPDGLLNLGVGTNITDSTTSVSSSNFTSTTYNNVFAGSGLTSITIPASVKAIGPDAFNGCVGLTSVTITGLADGTSALFGIGARAFNGCTLLSQSFTIPESVDYVGAYAFAGAGITEVTWDSPAAVLEYTFSGCTALNSVTVNADITKINKYAFSGCTQLTQVELPDTITQINEYAFSGCTRLAQIELPESLVNLGEACDADDSYSLLYKVEGGVFMNCTALTSVSIPAGVEFLPAQTFAGCTQLANVTFNNATVRLLNKNVFEGCTALQSGDPASAPADGDATLISIMNDAIYLDRYTDGQRTGRVLSAYLGTGTDVTFAEGVTSIGIGAFAGNTTITSVTIPLTVSAIEGAAFNGCTALKTVDFEVPAEGDEAEYSLAFPATSGADAGAFANCTALTTFTIPEHTTTFRLDPAGSMTSTKGVYLVSGCSALKDVYFNAVDCGDLASGSYLFCDAGGSGLTLHIGKDVTKIPAYLAGASSTSNAAKIKNVVFLGDKVETIGEGAFRFCTSLTGIDLPASVTEIGSQAFENCVSFVQFTVPANVKSIGSNAFKNCAKLRVVVNLSSLTITAGDSGNGGVAANAILVTTDPDATNLTTTQDGFIFYDDGTNVRLIGYAGTNTAITLPASFNGKSYGIYEYAFQGNTSLTSVTISGGVTSIGDYAFQDCTGLTSVTISGGVTSIGDYAFDGCSGLLSVSIGATVTEIGTYAFQDCTKITSFTLSEGLKTIGAYAFTDCDAVTEFVIPSTVTFVGRAAFYSCGALTTVTFLESEDPARTLVIQDGTGTSSSSNGVFISCSKLVSVTLPEGLTHLGAFTFYNCSALATVNIPSTVTSMGVRAFYGTSKLQTLYWDAVNCADFVHSSYLFNNSGNSVNEGFTVYFGEEVTHIPAYLFHPSTDTSPAGIPRLTTVVIEGNALKMIGANAFLMINENSNSDLETIYYGGSLEDLQALVAGIGAGNTDLLEAAIYLYSESTPPANDTDDGFAGVGEVSIPVGSASVTVNIAGYWHWTQDEELNDVVTVWVFTPAGSEDGSEGESAGTDTQTN